VTSGVASRAGVDADFADESESAVHVLVHKLSPPFLDGRTVFTRQLAPIDPVRDGTSDLAVFSKKGSALVREKREQAERAKAAAKLAALGGTALGNVMGVRDEEGEAAGTASPVVPARGRHSRERQRRRRRSKRPRRTTRARASSRPTSRRTRARACSRRRARSSSSASTCPRSRAGRS
jgi:hypothetical protein